MLDIVPLTLAGTGLNDWTSFEIISRIHIKTENRLRRETRLKTENSSDMNPVKDEFPVSNLSVHFPV